MLNHCLFLCFDVRASKPYHCLYCVCTFHTHTPSFTNEYAKRKHSVQTAYSLNSSAVCNHPLPCDIVWLSVSHSHREHMLLGTALPAVHSNPLKEHMQQFAASNWVSPRTTQRKNQTNRNIESKCLCLLNWNCTDCELR